MVSWEAVVRRHDTLSVVSLVSSVVLMTGCWRGRFEPTVTISPAALQQGIPLTQWHVVGPFYPPEATGGQADAKRRAFEEDYLHHFGLSEPKLDIVGLKRLGTAVKSHDSSDWVIRFDKLFRPDKPAVAYGATQIDSLTDTDAVLVFGAADAIKIWVNGIPVFETTQGPNGKFHSSPQVEFANLASNNTTFAHHLWVHMARAHFRRGRNSLLFKVYWANEDSMWQWGFNCALSGIEHARAVARERRIINRLVAGHVTPPDHRIVLHPQLREHLRTLGLTGRLEILDPERKPVCHTAADPNGEWSADFTELPDGLYTLRLDVPSPQEETVYRGDVVAAIQRTQRDIRRFLKRNERVDFAVDALAQRFAHLMSEEHRKPGDKGWEKKIVGLFSEYDDMLAALRDRRDPLRFQPGIHLRGFRSAIDGQVQHYIVGASEELARPEARAGLVVYYPARIETLRPFLKSVFAAEMVSEGVLQAREINNRGSIVLWTAARGNTAGAAIGNADLLAAIEAACQDYDIDRDRIYLFGSCTAGIYALQIAARHPGMFGAVAIAQPMTDSEKQDHTPSYPACGRFWAEANNPARLFANLRNVPVFFGASVESEVTPPEYPREFARRSAEIGIHTQLEMFPYSFHAHDADYAAVWKAMDFFGSKRTVENPKRVSLTTGQLKYGRAHWLRVTRLSDELILGHIDAKHNGAGQFSVKSDGIAQFELLLDDLHLAPKTAVKVTVNGRPACQREAAGRTLVIDVPGQPQAASALHKTAQVEGPILHAFSEPFVIVQGTTGSAAEVRNLERVVGHIQEAWQRSYFVTCPVKRDRDITTRELRDRNVVLVGTPETNLAMRRFFAALPIAISRDSVKLGGREFRGQHLGIACAYPNPLNRDRYVVVLGGTHPADLRLYEPSLSLKGWYDWAVWSSTELMAAGYWDFTWSRLLEVRE